MRRDGAKTLADVARLAGVSKATASKAFNGHTDVATETRQRVLTSAAELGYLPSKRTPDPRPQVWVALTSFLNPYMGLVLDGLLTEAQLLGASAVVHQHVAATDGGSALPSSPGWIREGLGRGAGAFALITTPVTKAHVRAARAANAPLIVVDPLVGTPEGALSVGATNWRGGHQATEHLIGLGHRRIAFIGAPADSEPGTERLAGYRSALSAGGIRYDPALVRPGYFSLADGLAARDLLQGNDAPTAVFAANDMVACGVLDAARLCGLSVPGDLSVVGFDDTIAAAVSAPPLTTVQQPLADMGALAMRTCVNALRGMPPVTAQVQLATSLVERGSTGPAPSQ